MAGQWIKDNHSPQDGFQTRGRLHGWLHAGLNYQSCYVFIRWNCSINACSQTNTLIIGDIRRFTLVKADCWATIWLTAALPTRSRATWKWTLMHVNICLNVSVYHYVSTFIRNSEIITDLAIMPRNISFGHRKRRLFVYMLHCIAKYTFSCSNIVLGLYKSKYNLSIISANIESGH